MDSSADDRYPLSFYYRIADQMVKQAAVFREEGNADDLYITLKRYLRLVADVVPSHRNYSKCCSKRKLHHKKILQDFIKEIEDLKPLVETNNSEIAKQVPSRPNTGEANSHLMFQRWKEKDWAFVSYKEGKVNHCSTTRAEDPNFKGNIVNTYLAPELAADTLNSYNLFQTRTRVAFAAERKHVINVNVVKHHSPSVLSFIESPPIVGHVSQITIPESRNEYLESSCEASSSSRNIKDVHISARLMEEFMELARANTNEDLETCGILGASLNNQTFYITTLIIPRQESTSNSCQALNEEQIYAIQDERSLFTAGWIHTHPSQTCFLSSIDLHTQYSYQVMLPEAVAIVMAPTDPTRNYGIFRLTDPGGMSVLRHCQESGFHTHSETADGSPIYECCSNVYINPNLRFETIDLRFRSP